MTTDTSSRMRLTPDDSLQNAAPARNPYTVLGAVPVYSRHMQNVLRGREGLVQKCEGCLRHVEELLAIDWNVPLQVPVILGLERQLQRLSGDSDTPNPPEDVASQVLQKQNAHREILAELASAYRHAVVVRMAREEREAEWTGMIRQWIVEGRALPFLMKAPEVSIKPHPHLKEEHLPYDFHTLLTDLRTIVARVGAYSRTRRKPNAALAAASTLLGQHELQALQWAQTLCVLVEYENTLWECIPRLEVLLAEDDIIEDAYRRGMRDYHPDRNVGKDTSYQSSAMAEARERLIRADAEERERIIIQLVFGQSVEFWDDEHRSRAATLAETFLPVFITEVARPPQRGERCDACKGKGVVSVQRPNVDYFPVTLGCEECRGTGVIPQAVADLRRAIRACTTGEDAPVRKRSKKAHKKA
ncbi:MAG: hypothetical protein G01um101425_303 [Candidatus Peregrinibacteria bacterium Gr01-1014_25]|nr:MAG: hypothetical protein G01um101425_303 [Candidatus Peregrinibacteria bacterium Gr01-1014_25]